MVIRARHGGEDLIDRDVMLRMEAREEAEWVRILTRRDVTERIIEIRFARP